MRSHRRSIALAVFALLVACSDTTDPQAGDGPEMARTWSWPALEDQGHGHDLDESTVGYEDDLPDAGGFTCSSDPAQTDSPSCTLRHRPDAPPLETYHTSFTAVQGKRTSYTISYLVPTTRDRTQKVPFMELVVPKTATLLDERGNPVQDGEPVLITIDLDTETFRVDFGPDGSTFRVNQPATLWFSLQFADVDRETLADLSVFYRPQPGDTWDRLGSYLDEDNEGIQAPVYHFSGYAVAW